MRVRGLVERVTVSTLNGVPSVVARRFRTSGIATRIVRPAVNRMLPGHAIVSVRSGPAQGLKFEIDPRREKFYWTGNYEIAVQRAFERVVSEGMTVWDVGAHIGFFATLAARLVGPEGRVYAFEPQPANRARLTSAVSLNRLEWVEVHSDAVADVVGVRKLYGHGSTSMWGLGRREGVEAIEVACTTLDELAASPAFRHPDLVKIDAEGAEVDILRGSRELARSDDVTFIVELGSDREVNEARGILKDHRFSRLAGRHWLAERRK
jgi:FkbM family methyltransferase